MVVHIKKALRLYLDYNVITCTHVLHLLFTKKPQKIVSLNTTTTISDFFQHFGNGTSTGSIGKNSLNLPSIGKISDIYLKTNKNDKNIMTSVTVIFFLKLNYI